MSGPGVWRTFKALVLNLPDDEVAGLSDRLKGRGPKARPASQTAKASPSGHGASPWAEAAAAATPPSEKPAKTVKADDDETPLWTSRPRKTSGIQHLARLTGLALLLLFLWIGVRTAFFGPGQKVEETPLPVAATFPDEAAAGTAEQFVRSYLTWDEADPEARAGAMAPWYDGGVVSSDLGWDRKGKQTADEASAVRVDHIDAETARVTVTANVTPAKTGKAKEAPAPRRVSVEVKVRATEDGAAVYGVPGIVGNPIPIPGPEAEDQGIADTALSQSTKGMAAQFFTAYGKETDVSSLTAPGASIRGLGGLLTEPQVQTWTVREGAADRRTALAAIDWTTPAGGRSSTTYEVELVRVSGGDAARWQIANVKGTH